MATCRLIFLAVLILGNVVCKKLADWQKEVDEHNKKPGVTWKAKLSPKIDYEDDELLKRLASLKIDYTRKGTAPKKNDESSKRRLEGTVYPTTLDLRLRFPQCESISFIRDQGACGSCWAVSAMSCLSDRYCIAYSKDATIVQKRFSYEDVLECCNWCIASFNGCNGGYVDMAMYWAQLFGVVSGEEYGNKKYCKPYFLSPTASFGLAPSCSTKCVNVASRLAGSAYKNDKRRIWNYGLYIRSDYSSNIEMVTAMKGALDRHGSLVATMAVYECFMTYSSGVYVRTSDVLKGYHAIRLIGWDESNPENPYWIVANSWGQNWGMSGFFWIRMYTNESEFENYVVEGNFV